MYGVNAPYPVLVGEAELVVEIGSGMGEATASMAAASPQVVLLAVEVHPAGVAALLRRLEEQNLANVRVARDDAVLVLEALLPSSVAEVRVFFPDPWPKAKHAKRRLVRPDFTALVASRLAPGGRLHLATDVGGYTEHALQVLADGWTASVVARPAHRPVTRFEQQGLDAGRSISDIYAYPVRA